MESTQPASVPAHITWVQGVPVVEVHGRLDTTSAPAFDAQTASLFADGRGRVLLDVLENGMVNITKAMSKGEIAHDRELNSRLVSCEAEIARLKLRPDLDEARLTELNQRMNQLRLEYEAFHAAMMGTKGQITEGTVYQVAGSVGLDIDRLKRDMAAREIEKRVKAHAPGARLDGFLVQKMERGLAEVILGFRRDPLVGPTVTVGLGGVLAEIYKDAATCIAPVDEAEALEMIGKVKGLATIRGYRNLPKGDIAALAKAIAAFSTLAHAAFGDVSEAEINPLLVKHDGEGVVAVDGLVVLKPQASRV